MYCVQEVTELKDNHTVTATQLPPTAAATQLPPTAAATQLPPTAAATQLHRVAATSTATATQLPTAVASDLSRTLSELRHNGGNSVTIIMHLFFRHSSHSEASCHSMQESY